MGTSPGQSRAWCRPAETEDDPSKVAADAGAGGGASGRTSAAGTCDGGPRDRVRVASRRTVRVALEGHRRFVARTRRARGRLRRCVRHTEDSSGRPPDSALGRSAAVHWGMEGTRQQNGARGARLPDTDWTWTSGSGSSPACSRARRWRRCAPSSGSRGRPATRFSTATRIAGPRPSPTGAGDRIGRRIACRRSSRRSSSG